MAQAHEDYRQVIVPAALIDELEDWLHARGLELMPIGDLGTPLPQWLVRPTNDTLQRLARNPHAA